MRICYIANALKVILITYGIVILTPIIVAIIYEDKYSIIPFLVASLISVGSGLFLKYKFAKLNNFNNLKKSEALLIVFLTWMVVSIVTGIPYLFYGLCPINAFFEAASGITSAGATILTDFSKYPEAFFFWRSMSQWLGGMGIIVLFVAILPQFAVAGRQMFFAEAPGPTEEKITPRVKHTATALWGLYLLLTILEITFLSYSGMPVFDAICNSFSTLSAGGFSPNPQSIMGYNNPMAEWIIIVFMFLAGTNFVLQYKFLLTRRLVVFKNNEEFKAYLTIIMLSFPMLAYFVIKTNSYDFIDGIRHSLFQLISLLTSTGFASQDFELWNTKAKFILFLLMLTGASAGSAAGGVKVVRFVLGLKHMKREIVQVIHPKAVLPIKLDRILVSNDVLRQTLAFIFFYFSAFAVSSFLITMIEGDVLVAVSGSVSSLGVIGPGFGKIGPMSNFDHLTLVSKFILSMNMIIGRLELIPFLVMFYRDFWSFSK